MAPARARGGGVVVAEAPAMRGASCSICADVGVGPSCSHVPHVGPFLILCRPCRRRIHRVVEDRGGGNLDDIKTMQELRRLLVMETLVHDRDTGLL